jgi:hypothetical protein
VLLVYVLLLLAVALLLHSVDRPILVLYVKMLHALLNLPALVVIRLLLVLAAQ